MILLPPPNGSLTEAETHTESESQRARERESQTHTHTHHAVKLTVDRGSRPIKDHIRLKCEQRGESHKQRGALLLPNAKLSEQVACNESPAGLLPSTTIGSDLCWQLERTVRMKAVTCPAKSSDHAIPNPVEIVCGDVDTARVAPEEDRVPIVARELVPIDRHAFRTLDADCTRALERPVALARQPVTAGFICPQVCECCIADCQAPNANVLHRRLHASGYVDQHFGVRGETLCTAT